VRVYREEVLGEVISEKDNMIRSLQGRLDSALLRQGLSYRAQFCPVTVTKIWIPYSQTIFFYQYTKKFLTLRAFHPCITLGIQTNQKLVKQIVEVKKSPQNGTFCLPLFLVTQVCTVVTDLSAIGSYSPKLLTVFPCYLALKWAIGMSSGLSNH